MAFGMQPDEATAFRIVDVAIEAGITFVDTANGYGAGAS
jgi:aryl-alcohol dehydrogenase-like predicted oxidoreductase